MFWGRGGELKKRWIGCCFCGWGGDYGDYGDWIGGWTGLGLGSLPMLRSCRRGNCGGMGGRGYGNE